MKFDFHLPTRILFGQGRLDDLAKLELPGRKALLVISNGKAMRQNGYVERVSKLLAQNGVESIIYDGVKSDPEIDNVMRGKDLFLSNNCEFIVGLGGGSTIDCAKAIAVMAKNPNYDIWDYIGDTEKGRELFVELVGIDILMYHRIKTGFGYKKVNGAFPIIAIPTTSGTGSECDPWTVTVNTETMDKLGIGGVCTFPEIAIVDPELTLSVPKVLTAYQGFDALFHCIECYFGTAGNILSASFAEMGIRNVAKYLVRAVNDGNDMEAREGLAFASMMGGFTLSTGGTCSEHAIAQTLAAYSHGLPHGTALIILSEAYFTFFARKGVKSLIELGRMLGEDPSLLPTEEQPMAAVYGLRKLKKACGLSDLKLSDWGTDPSKFIEIAEKTKRTGMNLFKKDPIMLDEADVVQILKQSYN